MSEPKPRICIYCEAPSTIPCPECGKTSVCEKHDKWYGPAHNEKCSEYETDATPV